MAKPSRDRFVRLLVIFTLCVCVGGEAAAESVAWTGATNNAFDTAGNWSGSNTPPQSNDSLFFGAAGAGTLNNNLTNAAFNVAGLTFNAGAGAFVIGGNAFTLTSDVTNNSTSLQTINTPITLSGSRTFTTTAGGGNITLGGLLGGSGGLTAAGGGTLTLTGSNTYGGGTSISNGSTLQLGSGGATGSVTGDITNNGALVFNRSDDRTFGQVISGIGGVIQNTGIVRLTAQQLYTGPTQINAGAALVLGVDSALSASTVVTVAATGRLDLGNRAQTIGGLAGAGRVYSYPGSSGSLDVNVSSGQTYTFAGSLGDTDPHFSFTKSGDGTQIIASNATYTGGTTISGGTLQLGNGGATGSLIGDVTNNGTLAIHRSNDLYYDGTISGTGGLTIHGGVLRLSGTQTYTGSTQINAGYLVLPTTLDYGISASTVVTVAADGALDLSGRTQKIAGLAGAGRVYSYGGTNESLTLDVAAGQTYSFSGSFGDSDPHFAFTKTGAGTQILSGTSTPTSGITVNEGTLQIGNGSSGALLGAGRDGTPGATGSSGLGGGGSGGHGANSITVDGSGTLAILANAAGLGAAGGQGGAGGVGFGDGTGGAGGLGGNGAVTLVLGNGGTVTSSGSIAGGAGGAGGQGGAGFYEGSPALGEILLPGGNGGNGGAGETAVVFTSNATLTNSGVITGGRGANGGNGGAGANGHSGIYWAVGANGGNGGNGGAGGAAIVITNGGTLINSGTISGGAGGSAGTGGAPGTFLHADGYVVTAGNYGGMGSAGSEGLGVVLDGGTTTLANQTDGIINNGVVYRQTGDGTLTNDGRINGGITYQQSGYVEVDLTNNGSINGNVTLQQPGFIELDLTNNGYINGSIIRTSSGRLNLVNNGFIGGNVSLQQGPNTVTLVASTSTEIRGISGNLFIYANSYDPMLILDGSGTQLYSSAVWGTTTLYFGSPTQEVVKTGSGTWVIDVPLNNNGFSAGNGTFRISEGALQVGSGYPNGRGALHFQHVVNNATLVFANLGITTQGTEFPSAISGTGRLIQQGNGTLILNTANTYTGETVVAAGTLIVDGSIASSSGVSVSAGAKLAGHGIVSAISGEGLVAPGDPQILTATNVDPSGGLDFTFKFTQAGAPDYANTAASGNDLLHLTGETPITFALTAANTFTIDFSGAMLADGQIYYGGFFTDAAVSDAWLSGAGFAFTGLGGFSAQFDGLVAQPTADFATGTVYNGLIMSFQISAVPEPGTAGLLLIGLLFACLLSCRKSHASIFNKFTTPDAVPARIMIEK